MTGTDTYLNIDGLFGGYGELPVVRDLHLTVRAGETVALLGPNGAGKSTTLLSCSGLLPLLGGRVEVFGRDIASVKRPERIARLGLCHVPEGRALFSSLSVLENLRLGARNRSEFRKAIPSVLEYFPELEPLMDRRAGLLSGGEQQMLAVGRALVAQPKLLMVDEASLGLAPVVVQRLLPRFPRIARETGCAVLLVEQHVQQALAVADRAYVLAHGELLVEGSAEELSRDRSLLESSYMGQEGLEPVASGSAKLEGGL